MTVAASKALLEGMLRANRAVEVLREIETCWSAVASDVEYVYLRFRALDQLGRYEELEALLEEVCSSLPADHSLCGLRQLARAHKANREGRTEDAVDKLSTAPPTGSAKVDAVVLQFRARCQNRLGMSAEAKTSFGSASALYESVKHYAGVVRCLVGLADAERLSGSVSAAIDFLHQAKELAQEHSLFLDEGRAHHNLGVCYVILGRPDAAASHYSSATRLIAEHGDRQLAISSKLGLSQMLLRVGKLAAAQEGLLDVLGQVGSSHDRNYGIAHEFLGELRLSQARFREAALHFRRAKKIGSVISDPELVYENGYRLAEAEIGLNALSEAEVRASEARDAFLGAGNQIDAATASRVVGQALLCQKKWKEAASELKVALATFEELDEQFEVHRVRRLLEAAKHKAPINDIRAAERPKWGVNIITKSKTTGESTLKEPEIICGHSHRFLQFLADVDRGAKSTVPILLEGETGTGKELVAQRIHARSSRHAGPFVAFNCGTSNPEMFDGEVFGHLKGSFTGAATDRKGLARTAHNGTLFLDEIGEMTKATQARMLRLLDSGEVRPVGSDEVVRTDLRLISATHQDLDTMIEKNEFRQDLFYRLATIRLRVPPLRERIEDLELLFQHFRDEAARKGAGAPLGISDSVLQKMADYPWPGNVRELRNSVHRLAGIFNGSLITTWWPSRDRHQTSTRDKISKDEMIDLLWETEGSVTRVSDRLEVSRPVIYRLLKQWGLDVNDFRSRRRRS